MITAPHTTASSSTRRLTLLLVLDQVHYLIGHSEILDLCDIVSSCARGSSLSRTTHIVSSHIDLGESKEFVAVWTGLHDFLEGKVHPGIAIDEMAIECFPVLEFHQHWGALGGIEKTKG